MRSAVAMGLILGVLALNPSITHSLWQTVDAPLAQDAKAHGAGHISLPIISSQAFHKVDPSSTPATSNSGADATHSTRAPQHPARPPASQGQDSQPAGGYGAGAVAVQSAAGL